MAFTTREVEGESPVLQWITHPDGSLTGQLGFYRTKRDGSLEEFTVMFRDLEVEDAACVGRGARLAIHRAREAVKKRMDEAYNRIITPGS